MNSTREIFPAGAPRASEDELPSLQSDPEVAPVSGGTTEPTTYSVVMCHLAPVDSVGWMSCGMILQNAAIS